MGEPTGPTIEDLDSTQALRPGAAATTDHIVLWLDLAEVNQMDEGVVRTSTPPGATILRLTDPQHGGRRHGEGTPSNWPAVLDAIDRLVRHARRLERASSGCRYWVTGRAGLPAFFHLGHRLREIAAVTFVHQPQNNTAPVPMPLDPPGPASAVPYFERTPWPIPHSDSGGPAALVVSSEHRPSDEHVSDAVTRRGTGVAGVVRAHSPAWLTRDTATAAMSEIRDLVRVTCNAHPRRSSLAAFIRGPSVLAFLYGAAISRRVCRDVQIYEFDGKRYTLAYELPYPPVPERNKVLFFAALPSGAPELALAQEFRAIQHELSRMPGGDRLELIYNPSAQPQDIYHHLQARRAPALHFSGHGGDGELMFQDGRGEPRPLSTSDLIGTIQLAGEPVRLVVLSACHSESHVAALLGHVDCVVAIPRAIFDSDARRFAITFYGRLAQGDSVRDAFNHGVQAMRLHRSARDVPGGLRDIEVPEVGAAAAGDPQLYERDPDCARETFLIQR